MKRLKKIIRWAFVLGLVITATIGFTELWVHQSTKTALFNTTKEIPKNKVGLLLGTGKYLQNGWRNLYYTYRIQAAVSLYKSGKISYLLVSGDNSREEYDEPSTIKADLIAQGIPENRIVLDYAGFRTLDSVVRAKKIFGQHQLTIISQPFHNKRAICIAKSKGIEAVGFNAKDVSTRYGIKVVIRERLARVKMLLDLLIGKEPKFLGDPIKIDS